MISEKFQVGSEDGRRLAEAYLSKALAGNDALTDKEKLQLSLLAEETLGMAANMLEEFTGEMYFSGEGRRWEIHLDAAARMTGEKKHRLIDVSTSGRNAAAKGFMGMVGEFMSDMIYNYGKDAGAVAMHHGMVGVDAAMTYDMTPLWTLSQLRSDAKAAHSEVELTELEKSVVASLADEIVVGVKGNSVGLVVVRDFDAAPKVNWSATDPISVTEGVDDSARAAKLTARFARRARLSPREEKRLSLLVEETLGMTRAMTDAFMGKVWLEGDSTQCLIHLEATARMDSAGEKRLVSAATSGKNDAPVGFMERIGRMIREAFPAEDMTPVYDDEYFEVLPDYTMYRFAYAPDHVPTWSLNAMKSAMTNATKAQKEAVRDALDDLEKSIVAKLADDVSVSVKQGKIDLVITRSFKS